MYYKASVILFLFFVITGRIDAASEIPHPLITIKDLPKVVCTSPVSYYIDHSRKLSFNDIRNKTFSTQTGGLSKAIQKYFQRANYWIKFSLENIDSLPAVVYLDAGYFGSIRINEITRGKITVLTGGVGVKKDLSTPSPELYSVKLRIPPRIPVQYVLCLSSTPYYGLEFEQVNIFSKKTLYEAYYHDYYHTKTFRLLQILFLGFMFSQMLYVSISRIIGIKRKEYLFYLFYLALVTVYYIFQYNDDIGIYWPFEYYPSIRVYTKSVLLALPYFFYLRFIRYFLNIKKLDENAYGKMIHLEYFIAIYVLTDTVLRFLLPATGMLNDILMITIFGTFVYGLTIIVPLIRYKRMLINLILTGSLVAGLGGVIGILITILTIDTGILQANMNHLLSGQIGIVVETIIFTASLGFKTRMMEREKIKNQIKLIAQLEENEMLREKMEETRNKIAQDLHDDIGSTLSSILLYSNAAKKKGQV